jgi:thiol-disulfide isomerase/thioredoxin
MHRKILIFIVLVIELTALASFPLRALSDTDDAGPSSKETRDRISENSDRHSPSIELTDLNDNQRRPLALNGNKAAVVVFVLHDCPISNQYAPEIQHLADEFAAKKVPFYLVHVDPELSLSDAKKHAKEYGYKLPVLIDRKHSLVKRLKATVVPEAFVIGPHEKVLYHGRIDDRYAAIGKPRGQSQRHDLRAAITNVLNGKPVEVAETKAIGCYIQELDSE